MFVHAQKPTKSAVQPARDILHRKSDSCRNKKAILQPSTFGSIPKIAPATVHEVQRSSRPPLDPATRAFMEPRLGHDLSKIPAYPKSSARIQAKLTVNTPWDIYEQEADKVADRVLAATAHYANSGALSRIQRFTGASTGQAMAAPASVDRVLASPGRSLPLALRQEMEQRIGHDFSQVRVHDDASAHLAARGQLAHAFTVGTHIVFNRGRYEPSSIGGKRLLAHELAHVVQQTSPLVRLDSSLAHEGADHAEAAVVQGRAGAVSQALSFGLQRKPMSEEEIANLKLGDIEARLAANEKESEPLVLNESTQNSLAEERRLLIARRDQLSVSVAPGINAPVKSAQERWESFLNRLEKIWTMNKPHVYLGQRIDAFEEWSYYVTPEEFRRFVQADPNIKELYYRWKELINSGFGGKSSAEKLALAEGGHKTLEPSAAPMSGSRFKESRAVATRLDDPFYRESAIHPDPVKQLKDKSQWQKDKLIQVEQIEPEKRASLDRLNEAYRHWETTKEYIHRDEFSPYEIEKDNIIPVSTRWDINNRPDPNNLETAEFDEYFFRSPKEYNEEMERRKENYRVALKACDKQRGIKWPKASRAFRAPDHIVCRERVQAEYHPEKAKMARESELRTKMDLDVGMPAVIQQGPVAAFAFHVGHEWLGWSTERSASLAGFAGGLTMLTVAKMQQIGTQRRSDGGSVQPDPMSPPPTHVASDPWAGPARKPDPKGNVPAQMPGRSLTAPVQKPPKAPAPPITAKIEPPAGVPTLKAMPKPKTKDAAKAAVSPKDKPMKPLPGGERRGTVSTTLSGSKTSKRAQPEVTVLRIPGRTPDPAYSVDPYKPSKINVAGEYRFRQYEKNDKVYQQASGRLGMPDEVQKHRDTTAQKKVSGGTGDDAGHLIGNRFGPPGSAKNLGRQNWVANRVGNYHALEDAWASLRRQGVEIDVQVTDVTRAGEKRPFMRNVQWTETTPGGTVKSYEVDFANTTTPESRIKSGGSTSSSGSGGKVIQEDFGKSGGN